MKLGIGGTIDICLNLNSPTNFSPFSKVSFEKSSVKSRLIFSSYERSARPQTFSKISDVTRESKISPLCFVDGSQTSPTLARKSRTRAAARTSPPPVRMRSRRRPRTSKEMDIGAVCNFALRAVVSPCILPAATLDLKLNPLG